MSDRALLVVAHPGHELRVHAWLADARPRVLVLTDGSGRGEQSRLHQSAALLAAVGAEPGAVFPRCSDRELYAALLRRDVAFARGIVEAIVAEAIAYGAGTIAGDALEGFNPAHDLCRYCINLAVTLLRTRHGIRVDNLEFALDGAPVTSGEGAARYYAVGGEALARKLDAVLAYEELKLDRELLLARYGPALFEHEALFHASPMQGVQALDVEPPYYESAGAHRTAAGEYDEVIRYREHVRPLVHGLWKEYGLPLPAPATPDVPAQA